MRPGFDLEQVCRLLAWRVHIKIDFHGGVFVLRRHLELVAVVALVLVTLTGVGGCTSGSHGAWTGTRSRGNFDDDVEATIVKCATEAHPGATVRVTVSDESRKYYVGVNFLDSDGNVIDSNSLKLTPESDSSDGEISAEVKFPMNEPKKASRVASCKLQHAF